MLNLFTEHNFTAGLSGVAEAAAGGDGVVEGEAAGAVAGAVAGAGVATVAAPC